MRSKNLKTHKTYHKVVFWPTFPGLSDRFYCSLKYVNTILHSHNKRASLPSTVNKAEIGSSGEAHGPGQTSESPPWLFTTACLAIAADSAAPVLHLFLYLMNLARFNSVNAGSSHFLRLLRDTVTPALCKAVQQARINSSVLWGSSFINCHK